MLGGRQFGTNPALWVGLLALCGRLWAEELPQFPAAPRARSARGQETAPNPARNTFFFGVMGQIARPGVYEFDTPQPQLVDLIHHAGGLTQIATNQIRVVRQGNAGQSLFYSPDLHFKLAAGDIVVADGPRGNRLSHRLHQIPNSPPAIQTADYSESPSPDPSATFQHVALVGVLDRPVILPVPETHANIPAILAYLGQVSTLAPHVKVVPVGGTPGRSTPEKPIRSNFRVPTVLYFEKQTVQAHLLPQFPEVYRVEPQPAVAPPTLPKERQTAELPFSSSPPLTIPAEEPTPIERFQRPLPHSVVTFPPLSPNAVSEPPLITEVRELENRIPNPEPISGPKQSGATPIASAETLISPTAEAPNVDSPAENNSRQISIALAFLVLVGVGIYLKLRLRAKRTNVSTIPSDNANVSSAKKPVCFETSPTTERTPRKSKPDLRFDSGTADLIGEEVLQALIYNQLPILEESADPQPEESLPDKPKSQKTFRIDPPTPEAKTTVSKPFIMKRPPTSKKSKPIRKPGLHVVPSDPIQPATVELPLVEPHPAKNAEQATTPASLLDRVLQQVNQPRAA